MNASALTDEELKASLQELRQLDNVTNWWYIGRAWFFLAIVIGAAVCFAELRANWGLSWWWNVPVFALAILFVGAGQHQIAGAGHEATHHILFKSRWLNELASDWICLYPLFSTTYHFRLHHLAHHNFINDPVRDPDVHQLEASGHGYDFPMEKHEFLWALVKNLWPPKLVRYIRERARINSLVDNGNPYSKDNSSAPAWHRRMPILFIVVQALTVATSWRFASPLVLALMPLVTLAFAITYLSFVPAEWFLQNRLRPVISHRTSGMMRATFLTAMFYAIGWGNRLYGASYPAIGVYFGLLWLMPIVTSFAFFMILRQVIQHGNGDRGRLTNTRVFFVSPAINFAVFPFGMDWHLPHHMYATVPHYRLRELHALLRRDPAYREDGLVVEGYFFPQHADQATPTVLDVLSPAYARRSDEVFIDDDVLVYDEMEPIASRSKSTIVTAQKSARALQSAGQP